jgi:hypothetical protein
MSTSDQEVDDCQINIIDNSDNLSTSNTTNENSHKKLIETKVGLI